MTKLLIQNIKISLQESESIAISKAKKIVSQEGLNSSAFRYSIFKKSIDARDKKNILQRPTPQLSLKAHQSSS